MEDIVSYREKESHLHLCNCRNDSARTDPTFHSHHCNYYQWWQKRNHALHNQKKDDLRGKRK